MAPETKRRKLSSGSFEAVPVEQPETTDKHEDAPTQKEQRRSLFVRSLPASITTERLTEYFSEHFPLKHATVVLDPKTKISKGFGFVTFADAEDAQSAVTQFNNSVLDGRHIKVELAQSRHRDAEDGVAKSGPNTTGIQLRAEREKGKADTQASKLIVRNLPWSIKTDADLAALFRCYGKVKHAVVPKKGPKVQYGFGIVMLRGKKNAEKAMAGVNGKEVDGRTLAVDWAVDKQTWQEQQQASEEVAKPLPETTTDDAGETSEVDGENDIPDADLINGGDDASDASEDDEDIDNDDVGGDDEEEDDGAQEREAARNDTTIFIRNLPFTTNDESLKEHFSTFGPIRYARVVYDPETERSRGTAFVCFFNMEDAKACVIDAPKYEAFSMQGSNDPKKQDKHVKHSVLENEANDPSGKYTLEGRVLQISRALSREGAERKATEASDKRDIRDRDKRRLYLLSEGSVPKGSKLYEQLGKAEMDIRESSARQRQKLLKTNPNLCLSLTRLSIRNLPRTIDSKALKALAREAVVGFSKDAKAGIRAPLSKEELGRGGAEEREAERKRKSQGKGIVRQAKVVFEDKEGSKVKDGVGRSRGYGFIEYASHRNALAGLRWLNGHAVKSGGEKPKRLIVEFAIENAQVLQRRNERERKRYEDGPRQRRDDGSKQQRDGGSRQQRDGGSRLRRDDRSSRDDKDARGQKRKRSDSQGEKQVREKPKIEDEDERNRIAKRNRIISKKRQGRKARKG
jgi:nucleolar protein 4